MPLRPPAGFISAFYDPLNNPNAPTIGTATAGDATASVAFTAPANVGGSAISAYSAISTPGGVVASAASSPISVTGLTNDTAYTFRVWATNTYGPSAFSAASNSVTPVVPAVGQDAFTTAGTYTWVAPAAVSSVSVVCVGGGGGMGNRYVDPTDFYYGGGGGALAYANNISVTSGASYTVVVGAGGVSTGIAAGTNGGDSTFNGTSCGAQGGRGGTTTAVGAGGTVLNGTGGSGGAGGGGGATSFSGGGGGGAGGYAGDGGVGMSGSGTGGAAAGGNGASGGGVGILGQGTSGTYGSSGVGTGGSGGTNGSSPSSGTGVGGLYGGGGLNTGGKGAVRIIYPGNTRLFPSTDTGNL